MVKSQSFNQVSSSSFVLDIFTKIHFDCESFNCLTESLLQNEAILDLMTSTFT